MHWNKGYMAKRMLWKNGWSSGSHHTKPPPYQNGCSPKTLAQIIITAKWFVRHSSTSPNQQRRPLPSLLSLSFFCDMYTVHMNILYLPLLWPYWQSLCHQSVYGYYRLYSITILIGRKHTVQCTLLEMFWRILLYVTDCYHMHPSTLLENLTGDPNAKLYTWQKV